MSTPWAETGLVEIIEIPSLREPTLILAIEGWIDAAGAAKGARNQLLEAGAGRSLAHFNTDRLLDHRHRRPVLRLVDSI